MKITITCESLEEFNQLMTRETSLINQLYSTAKDAVTRELKEEPKAEKPAEDPKPKAENPAKEPKAEKPTEESKVDIASVRHVLGQVNRIAGSNLAKEFIGELGHKALTEVTDPQELATLKAKAEQYLKEHENA